MGKETIRLKKPANHTVQGPRIIASDGNLVVEYDYGNDDGTIEWMKVKFEEVLAYEWRDNSCCLASHVINSQTILCRDATKYHAEIVGLWKERYGNREPEEKCFRFKHFLIYFDDAGSLNIIASNCIV